MRPHEQRAEQTTATGLLERLLVVKSGLMTLALAAPIVEDILPAEESRAAVIVNDQEVIYRVCDLAGRFGQTAAGDISDARVILCGYGGRHKGFRVNRVLGQAEMDPRQISALPPQFTGEERTWFNGFILFQDTVALLVNPEWLFEEPSAAPVRQPLVREMEVVDAERPA